MSEDPSLISTYGFQGTVGGDNFYEGTLDVTYISSIGTGTPTIVANTNQSASTEETTGFGYALLAFSHMLAVSGSGRNRNLPLPRVVSMSLGSLSYDSCALLCDTLANETSFSMAECQAYMATQRQVCTHSPKVRQSLMQGSQSALAVPNHSPQTKPKWNVDEALTTT